MDNGCVLRGGFPNIKVLRGRCKCDLALRGRAFVPRFAVVEHETSSRYQAAIMLNRQMQLVAGRTVACRKPYELRLFVTSIDNVGNSLD